MHQLERAEARERRCVVRAVAHRHRVDARVRRHPQVVRRVADHQARAGSTANIAISSSSIAGCGLGVVSSAQRDASKTSPSPVCASARSRPAAALAGRDRELVPVRAQALPASPAYPETAAGPRPGPGSDADSARPRRVALRRRRPGTACAASRARPRPITWRARALVGHRQAEVAAGRLDARGDRPGRIDQRAVPVEHEQVKPLRHRRGARLARGIDQLVGKRGLELDPLAAQRMAKPSARACRNIRFTPALRERLVELEVAVLVVADDRKPEVGEVDPDLVRAAGGERRFDEPELAAVLDEPELGPRGLPALAHAHAPLA